MNAWLALWETVCIAGLALCARSLAVLGRSSPFTFAGWLCTAGYFFIAAYDAWVRRTALFHADYVLVAALTFAFIVAGVRREPQAEPWWWPQRSSPTPGEPPRR